MRLINQLSLWAGLFGAILLAVTGLFLTYEVVARYFFIKPTTWAAEISQLCLIWGCLLAMAWVLTLRQHITVNALTSLLPRSAQKVCVAVSLVGILVFSIVIVFWGWDIFYESWVRGRTTGSLLNLPTWVAELPLPLGFFLFFAQAACELKALWGNDIGSLGGSHE
ncbi:MAG: TRAP transporter small permease [Pseudomonadota bacterium]|nr:TRAP transporter small permease [Pseudomonadota bacterium]